MNNFLLWIGGLVTVGLGLLFAGPHFVDWNSYRSTIEQEASRVFGRRVRVGGTVNVRILPIPYVSFEKLSIADSDSNSGGTIIRADTFKMWLSVPPLLQGIVEAQHVDLRRPVVELVFNDQGGGNWQDLQIDPGAISFLPASFALETLDVIDGQIIVRDTSNAELTRVEGIEGTLSALSVGGPFKFNGKFTWQDETRALRLSTGQPNRSGDIRLKASLSKSVDARPGRALLIDGVVSGLKSQTAFKGTVTGKLSGLTGLPTESGSTQSAGDRPAKPAIFDFRSDVSADTQSVQLNAINLALETDGPPQLMTGKASLKWVGEPELAVELNSRWIDFDRFSSGADGTVPLDAARQGLVALGRALPKDAVTNVRVAFDQATLGGQALGAIQLGATRTSGPLRLREFEADVPGGGKLALSGTLSVSKDDPGFRGRVTATGQSLLKFLRWGLGDDALAPKITDGPFSIESQLRLSETGFALTGATADLGDTPLRGALNVVMVGKRSIMLNLEGHTLSWNRISPYPFGAGLVNVFDGGHGLRSDGGAESRDGAGESERVTANSPPSRVKTLADLANRYDLRVGLKAAKLIDGDNEFQDFSGTLDVTSGTLSVPELQFSHQSGLEVDIAMAGGKRRSSQEHSAKWLAPVKGIVDAKSHLAVSELLRLLGVQDVDPLLRQKLSALAPLRVASVLHFGSAIEPSAELKFDGTSRGGRIVARLELTQGLKDWRLSPMRVAVTIDNPSAHRIYKLIADSRAFLSARVDNRKTAKLSIKAAGVPDRGLLARAILDSQGLKVNYYGNVALAKDKQMSLDGDVTFQAADARQAMALFGIELGSGVNGVAMNGRFQLARKDKTLRMHTEKMSVGASTFTGMISITEQTNAPSKLIADIKSNKAVLPELLRVVLANNQKNATLSVDPLKDSASGQLVHPAAVTQSEGASQPVNTARIWPQSPFDLAPLTNIEGYVTAKFDTFAFAPDGGLSVRDAELQVALAPGKISVTKLDGKALGGDANAAFEIKKAPAGVDLTGTLKMRVGEVAHKSEKKRGAQSNPETAKNSAEHAAVFDLTYKARAFAPQGLASDLDGSGKLVLADASLTGLTAKEVRQTVSETMASEGPVDGAAFAEKLKGHLKQGQISLGSLEIPVTLKDGAVNIAPIEIDGPDGKTTFTSSLEVSTMKFDSEWKIAALDPEAKDTAKDSQVRLPPVMATYVGDLSALMTVEPRLSTGALEREITVRKMERDVTELERLRKLDEARAKEEADRRRQLEARLAEQRRLQAERERQLLLEQQQIEAVGPDGVPLDGEAQIDPNAVPEAEEPPKPRRRVRRPPPPKKDVWNPFQITPY